MTKVILFNFFNFNEGKGVNLIFTVLIESFNSFRIIKILFFNITYILNDGHQDLLGA